MARKEIGIVSLAKKLQSKHDINAKVTIEGLDAEFGTPSHVDVEMYFEHDDSDDSGDIRLEVRSQNIKNIKSIQKIAKKLGLKSEAIAQPDFGRVYYSTCFSSQKDFTTEIVREAIGLFSKKQELWVNVTLSAPTDQRDILGFEVTKNPRSRTTLHRYR